MFECVSNSTNFENKLSLVNLLAAQNDQEKTKFSVVLLYDDINL